MILDIDDHSCDNKFHKIIEVYNLVGGIPIPLWKFISSPIGMMKLPMRGEEKKRVPNHQPVHPCVLFKEWSSENGQTATHQSLRWIEVVLHHCLNKNLPGKWATPCFQRHKIQQSNYSRALFFLGEFLKQPNNLKMIEMVSSSILYASFWGKNVVIPKTTNKNIPRTKHRP